MLQKNCHLSGYNYGNGDEIMLLLITAIDHFGGGSIYVQQKSLLFLAIKLLTQNYLTGNNNY